MKSPAIFVIGIWSQIGLQRMERNVRNMRRTYEHGKVYISRIGENLIKELVDYSKQAENNAIWGDKKYPVKGIN